MPNRIIRDVYMNTGNPPKKEVILLLLDQFADFELAYLAPALNIGVDITPQHTPYIAKTLSLDGKMVQSIGGINVIPDYSLATLPEDYAALVLIGGFTWFESTAQQLLPLIEKTIKSNKLLAAICNATTFLAIHGLLNEVKHTSNQLDVIIQQDLQQHYSGQANYLLQPVVCDQQIITANGFASLEFTQQILLSLQLDTPQKIAQYYHFFKFGLYHALQNNNQ